jgi:RNA polymerase sigma-70 factor, ECF subfamily
VEFALETAGARELPPGAGSAVREGEAPLAVDVETWYRQFGPLVLRRCRRLLRDEEKAVDAMHDVFVNLLRSADRVEDAQPASLLLRMATNVSLNRLRTARRHPEDTDDAVLLAIADAEEPEARSIARLAVAKLLGREEESTRVMAVMHLVDGLTLDEVGREVGLSAAAVRKRIRGLRARVAALAEAEAAAEAATTPVHPERSRRAAAAKSRDEAEVAP